MPYDEHIKTRVSHGLVVLSKYPIISIESYLLKQHPDHDEPYSVLFAQIQVGDKTVDICNVHFGNSDLLSSTFARTYGTL